MSTATPRVLVAGEALIAALLTLERADAPRQRSERVDLAERARAVIDQQTGVEYAPFEGTFTAADGSTLRPGWAMPCGQRMASGR